MWFSHSVVSDSFASPWTVACQAPLSVGSSRQQYWSGLPFPSPEWVTSQGADRLSQGGSHTHSHPTQPGQVLSLQRPLGALPFPRSLTCIRQQPSPLALTNSPVGRLGIWGEKRLRFPSAHLQTHRDRQAARRGCSRCPAPSPGHGNTYRGHLQKLLVAPVQIGRAHV